MNLLGYVSKNNNDKNKIGKKDRNDGSVNQNSSVNHNNDKESKLAALVQRHFEDARAVRISDHDELGFSVEEIWQDEINIYKGGGLQWSTNIAPRSKRDRQLRPNSEDNFVFNTMTVLNANVTMTSPEVTIEGVGDDDMTVAEKLTYASRFNDQRNCFNATWDKFVFDFTSLGPTVCMVHWDNDWMGGTGPDKWVGDVRLTRIKRGEFFADHAIDDWEDNLQECEYIIRRPYKKLDYFRKRWEDKGSLVWNEYVDDIDDFDSDNRGANTNSAYLYEYYHKGFPCFMPEERVKELKKLQEKYELKGDRYKAQYYKDAASGDIEGVHVAYICNGIVLQYEPYAYEHGKYPFVYATNYYDESSPYGFGEIRNIKIPQVLHNKADEIEIEASVRQGLGGKEYQKGAISKNQLKNILENSGKGGMYFEVDNINLIKDRTGVQVPASIINYKNDKRNVIETVSQITPSVQGRAEYANMPFKALAELGARSDVKIKKIVKKLERFLIEINKLRIDLFAQFYTEERFYRIKGSNGKTISGTITSEEMFMEWNRDEVLDENGESVLDEFGQKTYHKEKFVPEFDVRVQILSEKPTDRNYYTSVGFEMFARQLMTGEDLWYTIEEGKFPPKDDILKNVKAQNVVMQMTQAMQQLPQDMQQQYALMMQQMLQQFVLAGQQQDMQLGQQKSQGQAMAQGQQMPQGQDMQQGQDMSQMANAGMMG